MSLTAENYSKGFLVDEELMGGVTPSTERPGEFVAYVMNHLTGEYLGYQGFGSLDQALVAINQVKRDWAFESVSGCGAGKCAGGNCKVGGCGKKLAALAPGAAQTAGAENSEQTACSPSCSTVNEANPSSI
jgi:hypothetical protein